MLIPLYVLAIVAGLTISIACLIVGIVIGLFLSAWAEDLDEQQASGPGSFVA